ncbi:hypothetical protein E3N88_38919 [Mikania micrantha]|uniref:Reverse transcriptase domain-containing protein n=1 Tax=Mikania micrantha TaxID=192012 RepID=A0A5N6LXV9_9ASTR|nr:hypothetical protein E3N88_38919 [Mikania micrantha]
MITDVVEVVDEDDSEVVSESVGTEEIHSEVSFHAISGSFLPQTLRLPGKILNTDVVVLIDGGSTHNFLEQALVDRFGLQVDTGVRLDVVVANREKLTCVGRGSTLFLQISSVVTDVSNPPTPCQAVQVVLNTFPLVFQEPVGLPPQCFHDHDIPLLPGSKPISSRPYRQPYLQKTEIERQVRELLKDGLILPSHSPFSSPVLFVKKLDGSWQFCVDYRVLNDIKIKDKYPIPMIDELLDELHGAIVFSKLDLRAGYHQIRVREGDIHKTAFRTHDGHYEFVVMPFGLTNDPATFQCLMNDIFRPYLRKFILVFFDDILVYSKTLDDHLKHLYVVLELLFTNHRFAKQSKCCFGVSQVNYLGHIISSGGVAVEVDKVQAVLSWPTPSSAKGVRGFLGLAGYYRKFVKGFGELAAPLHKLVGKGSFKWDDKAEAAFQNLKAALTSTPTVALPDWSHPFTVECDASGVGIGAVLTQRGRPLAYYSSPLKGAMLAWSTYEKEM